MYRFLSSLALLASLQACDSQSLSTLPEDQVPAVWDDGIDWLRLTDFETLAGNEHTALYSRATAYLYMAPLDYKEAVDGPPSVNPTSINTWPKCSGGLIDDEQVVLAEHCDGTNTINGGPEKTLAVAQFGRYGVKADVGDFTEAIVEARRRLKQLGIPHATVEALAVPTFTEWVCRFNMQDGTRDVAVWGCDPNIIQVPHSGGTFDFELMPGHVWGHYNTQVGFQKDDFLEVPNHTYMCGDNAPHRNLVLSEGDVVDTVAACNATSDFTDCFHTLADWVEGSSGAPILNADHEIVGVVSSGAVSNGPISTQCLPLDPAQIPVNPMLNPNKGAAISALVPAQVDDTRDGVNAGNWTGTTDLVGAAPSFPYIRNCPVDTRGSGLVGTRNGDGVGNIGLVCTPDNGLGDLRIDSGVVMTRGSADIGGYINPTPRDLNDFLKERLSWTEPNHLGQHTLAMCPPGHFLVGLEATELADSVESIVSLHCRSPSTGHTATVWVSSDKFVDTGDIGVPYTSTVGATETLDCGSAAYFGGLRVYADSNSKLKGFEARCRK